MFLIMQWSINRGFLRYLNSTANESVELMVGNLQKAYGEHKSWDFFRSDPLLWATRMMDTHLDKNFADKEGKPSLPRIPLIVLDADGKTLFGNPVESKEVDYRAIVHDNKTVGFVGILPPKHFLSPHQMQFLREQKLALITAVLALGLVGLVFSLPLARRLVRPIKSLARAIHELSSGEYGVRVPVTSSDELGSLARAFNTMAMTLEKNEKARRQWVADISHELRTPLAILRGEIEALMEGVRNTTPDAIRSLHAEVTRLHRLVDDLHQLTLSDLGALTYRKEDLDPAEVLQDAIRAYNAEFARKDIELSTNIPEGPDVCIFADGERLRQLFSNLLDNSLKYTDDGGKLLVCLRCDRDEVTIDFEDSSPGVPPGDMERLFDRLYRVESSRNRASEAPDWAFRSVETLLKPIMEP